VFAGLEAVYWDQWDTRWWWDSPPLPVAVDIDSTVRAEARGFFDDGAFSVTGLALKERHSWVGECSWVLYPAIAESLRERAYRIAVGASLDQGVPRHVRDSLRSIPADTNAVEGVLRELMRGEPLVFKYWRGYEDVIQVAWVPSLRSFVMVQCGV